MDADTRNVMDEFKMMSHEKIVANLNQRGVELEVAIENTLRDYNMGTIVRNANAFGVRKIHVIGRRQWNKRGAMATDKYLEIVYHKASKDFVSAMREAGRVVVAIDITKTSQALSRVNLGKNSVFVFGQEGPGLSDELLQEADTIVHIEQLGSTRSINVGVASGIVMYEWLRRNVL